MPRFVLEIGFEEMPARFQAGLAEEFARLAGEGLTRARIAFSGLGTGVTPRRLTVMAGDVALVQTECEEVVTGPPARIAYDAEGNLTKAGAGFAKTQGVDTGALFVQTTDKGEYLAARKCSGGIPTLELLPAICAAAITGLTFPKKMRWGGGDFAFGRPIRWILALFGTDAVSFEIAGIPSGRITHGHRVMGPGPFELASADDYQGVLATKARVVLDPAGRRRMIASEAAALAELAGGRLVENETLLEEVAGLVEFPVPVLGRFADKFLELPREVLLTSMVKHQKCFGVEKTDGSLLPCFLATLGLEPRDREVVRLGWERVLRARLEDARFFFKADMAADLDAWLEKLENVVFLGPLGSIGEKTRRVSELCGRLAGICAAELDPKLRRAGRLSKADLVSQMVGEFAELQGIMGGIYAKAKGESDTVSRAVAEQYLPLGPDSPVPATLAGALLSIADKIDTLAGCFSLDLIPTGAADPYALRRQALGVCRTIIEHGLRLDLAGILAAALAGYQPSDYQSPAGETLEKLSEFFAARLKAYFTGLGYDTLTVEAAVGAGFNDIFALKARLDALAGFSKTPDFARSVLTFKRAANIIRKQAAEEDLSGAVREDLLAEPAERELFATLTATGARFEALWAKDDFAALLLLLGELRPSVDAFFDNVMVMTDDLRLRRNRLNLLTSLVGRLARLADFSALQM